MQHSTVVLSTYHVHAAAAGAAHTAHAPFGVAAQPVAAACAQCGSVVSVNAVDVNGDAPNVIGTIAGGVITWALPLTRQYGTGAPDANDGEHVAP